MDELRVAQTALKGLYTVDLVVHADSRGSFREAYQLDKLAKLGLPYLGPVQWNISDNLRRGILRGIHAEPWDKYIHVIQGEVFAAIVDLRPESPTFQQHLTFTLNPANALFVAQGFGNSYQVLSDGAIYGYLVNAHYRPGVKYLGIRYDDPALSISWPLEPGPDDISEKDRLLPTVAEAIASSALRRA